MTRQTKNAPAEEELNNTDYNEEEEEERLSRPPFLSRQIAYSVLPLIIIVASLFIGKIIVDYLSGNSTLFIGQKDGNKVATPTPPRPAVPSKVVAWATGVPITDTPTPTPSPRPTDPIINDTQRKYSNSASGIEFLYPKEWSITQDDIRPNSDAGKVFIALEGKPSQDPQEAVLIIKNPLEVIRNVSRSEKEDIVIDGKKGTISVSAYCNDENDNNGSTCEGGYGSVGAFIYNNEDVWFVNGFTISKAENITSAVQKMKDFLSTVKFL